MNEDFVTDLSLEELGNVPVVVSGKQASRLFNAPVNAYVFSEEAIQFLPVDSIPEMLRYAPGVHVVRPTNGNWGIGIHGMSSKWFGRVPFTVDDQSVDASIFSGLFGSQHDLVFADIASVEVVYGAGGILWDNNGGNGTVNVVMKTAFETLGNYAQARVGTHNRSVEARTGWSIDEDSAARVYGKYQNRRESAFEGEGGDDWETFRAGMRYDYRWSSEDLLSLTADVHGSSLGFSSQQARSEEEQLIGMPRTRSEDEELLGLNLQSKWTRQFGDEEGLSVRAWLSFSDFSSAYANFDQNVLGIEGRSRTQLVDGSELVLNGGLTGNQIHFEDNYSVSFDADETLDASGHVGAQWTKPLVEDKLDLTTALSLRYETLGDTLDWSPSVSLLYRPSDKDRIWLSYNRSSRPLNSLIAYGETINKRMEMMPALGFPPISRFHIQWRNNDLPDNEQIESIELGYRHLFDSGSEFGMSVYFNQYDDLIGQVYEEYSVENFPADPYLEIRIQSDNLAEAETYGLDVHYTHVFTDNWRATLSYAYLEGSYQRVSESGSSDPFEAAFNAILFGQISAPGPQHIASLWLVGQLNEAWRMDLGLRYTDAYGTIEDDEEQASILQLDARLSWQPTERLEVALVGRNLLDSHTDETLLQNNIGDTSEQERELYLELTYLF